MDFFFKNLESAQAQAKLAALNAQKTAKGFAEQVSKQSKTLAEHVQANTQLLAEQASSMSKEAAESAQHRLRGLDAPYAQALAPKEPEKPSAAVLAQYGITPEFMDFVRSLTYSTFRDFPADALPAAKASDGGAKSQPADAMYLTPWQEHHAMLVVQVVKEINELRYVLCPKRMTDAQFWQIYFRLADKYLPEEATDPNYKPPATIAMQGLTLTDLQAKFAALSTSAKQWTDQTGTTLRNAAAGHFGGSTDSPTASSTLKEIARSKSGALPASAAQESGKENQAAAKQKDAGLGHDQELEAYLHDAEAKEQHGSAAGAPAEHEQTSSSDLEHVEAADAQESEAGGSDSDNDFDKYLNELSGSDEDAGKAPKAEASDYESGEDLDLDDYMRVLADEDKKA